MTSSISGRVARLAFVCLLASTLVAAGGTGLVTATAECSPEDGEIDGCEGDVGTVEAILGNLFSVANAGLIFIGLTGVATGLMFWASGGVSATLKSKGGFLIGAGLVVLIASFALEPLLGLVEWIASDGVNGAVILPLVGCVRQSAAHRFVSSLNLPLVGSIDQDSTDSAE